MSANHPQSWPQCVGLDGLKAKRVGRTPCAAALSHISPKCFAISRPSNARPKSSAVETVEAPSSTATGQTRSGVIASQELTKSYRLPVEDLAVLARQAGLEWVQSDADKVAAVQAAIAAEPPVHVPREPRPAPAVSDEPLVLIETKRDCAS